MGPHPFKIDAQPCTTACALLSNLRLVCMVLMSPVIFMVVR